MKIIDLLNKIANREEVPKKIKYRKCIFEYEEKYKDYFTKNGIIPTTFDTNGIFRNIFLDYNNFLNDEVEIIEEKKLPEKLPIGLKQTKDGIFNTIVKDHIQYELNEKEEIICKKIHEIIDYLDYLKSKERE